MATRTETVFATVEEAIEDIRDGKFVIVVDAADRENEGDLTIAAQFATPEAINFMATHARGLICLCLTPERCDDLGLEQMARQNETPLGTAFTVTIEAREGVTTGISAPDRSRTIQVAVDASKGRHDLVTPGHIFPLRARAGPVLRGARDQAADDRRPDRVPAADGEAGRARCAGATADGVRRVQRGRVPGDADGQAARRARVRRRRR